MVILTRREASENVACLFEDKLRGRLHRALRIVTPRGWLEIHC